MQKTVSPSLRQKNPLDDELEDELELELDAPPLDELDDVDEVDVPHVRKLGWQSVPLQQSGRSGNPGRHFSVYDGFEQLAVCPLVHNTIPPEQNAPLLVVCASATKEFGNESGTKNKFL